MADNKILIPLAFRTFDRAPPAPQDNGPENHSRRTQFLKHIVEFAHHYQLNIRLAYYPPYSSKYNAIEHTWMDALEAQVHRLSNQGQQEQPNLGKWFIDISCNSA